MDIRRSINTRIWADSWIEELTPTEKLVWIYLLTSPYSNMLGIYEISLKRIATDTGINIDTIKKALDNFERAKKAYYYNGYVILVNWIKNQSMNPNMYRSAETLYTNLPNYVKDRLIQIGIESFESLSNPLKGLPNPSEKGNGNIESEVGKLKKESEPEILSENNSQNQINNWRKWINENAPSLNRMRQPLTDNEILKIRDEYKPDIIQEQMIAMENYIGIVAKYKSANLTLRNWIKRAGRFKSQIKK